jgi:D-arabinose 1-dehydrogenase-like Zn-dependent alcohol dehydrogenase
MRRAVRLAGRKTAGEAEVDLPEIGASNVLIRIAASGFAIPTNIIAGISRIDRLPVTLGHEIAGWIEKVGSDIKHVTRRSRMRIIWRTAESCEFMFAAGTVLSCGEMIGKHRDGDVRSSSKVRQECIRAPR